MRACIAIVVPLIGLSCASPGAYDELNKHKRELLELGEAPMLVEIALSETEGLSDSQQLREEKRLYDLAKPACIDPFLRRLDEGYQHAADAVRRDKTAEALFRLPAFAENMEDFLKSCTAEYGLDGRSLVELPDDRRVGIPTFLRILLAKAELVWSAQHRVWREEEESALAWQAFALGFSSSIASDLTNYPTNPNQTYIAPYSRRDGTYVRGHWRTLPNYTCLDNIRGCR